MHNEEKIKPLSTLETFFVKRVKSKLKIFLFIGLAMYGLIGHELYQEYFVYSNWIEANGRVTSSQKYLDTSGKTEQYRCNYSVAYIFLWTTRTIEHDMRCAPEINDGSLLLVRINPEDTTEARVVVDSINSLIPLEILATILCLIGAFGFGWFSKKERTVI